MMLVPDDEFDAAAQRVAGVKKAPTLDEAAANVLDGQRTQLRTSLYGALDSNPDEAARAKNLSNKSGVPVDIVQRNYAQVNRNVQLNEFDETLKRSPLLGQWLSNPNNAKISHDDSTNLAGIEREYGTIKPIERSFLEEITEPVQRGYAKFKKAFALGLADTPIIKGLQNQQRAAAEANGITYDPKIQQKISLDNYQRGVEKFPVPENIQRGLQEIGEATNFSEGFSAIIRNPAAVKEVIFESIGVGAPGLAVTAASIPMGPLAVATAAGTTSFLIEYATTMDEVITSQAEKINTYINIGYFIR